MSRLSLAACILFITACGGATRNLTEDSTIATDSLAAAGAAANGTALDVQPLTDYFLKNNIQVTDSLTFWVIDNAVTFDSLFSPAKTMDNKITTPDFGTQMVVAAAMPMTDNGTQIQLQNAIRHDDINKAELHFTAIAAEKKPYRITPVWLGILPKTGLQSIDLYTGNRLSKTQPVTQ